MIPNALTIAGSDSGGGAGIQADLKTFSALGVFGTSVVTALTAQNTREVRAIHDPPVDFIASQIDTVLDDIDVHAVKIGMLSTSAVIETVADRLSARYARSIVLDPVMVAKSGDKLLRDEAVDCLRRNLLPLATVLTPNLPEAAELLGESEINTRDQMPDAAQALLDLGPDWVLLKGGHLDSDESPDLLTSSEGHWWFTAQRVATSNTHGTGCSLSSAIAARLALGEPVREAVAGAKSFLDGALRHADDLNVGHGHGPVHHFHRLWAALEGRGELDVETA